MKPASDNKTTYICCKVDDRGCYVIFLYGTNEIILIRDELGYPRMFALKSSTVYFLEENTFEFEPIKIIFSNIPCGITTIDLINKLLDIAYRCADEFVITEGRKERNKRHK